MGEILYIVGGMVTTVYTLVALKPCVYYVRRSTNDFMYVDDRS